MLHVQHDYISSFNQSDHCFLASSLPLSSSLLKLPKNALKNVSFAILEVITTLCKITLFNPYQLVSGQISCFWKSGPGLLNTVFRFYLAAGGLDSSVCLGASAAAPRQESLD